MRTKADFYTGSAIKPINPIYLDANANTVSLLRVNRNLTKPIMYTAPPTRIGNTDLFSPSASA